MQIKNLLSWENIALSAFMMAFVILTPTSVEAHEDQHTHPGLTSAAFELLNDYLDSEGLYPNHRPTPQDIANARQGSIDEDICPRYYSHFYNPNTPTLKGSNVLADDRSDILDGNCAWSNDPNNIEEDEVFFQQQLATDRAADLWHCALEVFRGNVCTEPAMLIEHPATRKEAFKLLGGVLHLLEDMTSPAHVHNDPHGKPGVKGFGDCSGQDADDFENWGWCLSRDWQTEPDEDHGHIWDYLSKDNEERMKAGTWDKLMRLYNREPRGVDNSSGNAGSNFIEQVARVTYVFTSFHVKLRDVDTGTSDKQPESELRRMLDGDPETGCLVSKGLCDISGGWNILGPHQNIGFSDGLCGRSEGTFDTFEEWWPMEDGNMGTCVVEFDNGNPIRLSGYAYIENAGGEGGGGQRRPDNFIPQRYGCIEGTEQICGGGSSRSKALYQRLYGTHGNNDRKTLLRIYGDVLYPTAIAYGAGLIQTFIEELNKPTAKAGGLYRSEACHPVDFDASDSTDQGEGSIVRYDWDFNGDGIFDLTTDSPFAQHTYADPYEGMMIVQVTDNDGFSDSDSAVVVVTLDVTPPDLNNMIATPNSLWPPNHTMRTVLIDPKADDACGVATCQILSAASNESSDGRGSGHSHPDIKITGDLTLQLRAEREGAGTGRAYTVTVQCTDVNNNNSIGDIEVSVSHSRTKNAE